MGKEEEDLLEEDEEDPPVEEEDTMELLKDIDDASDEDNHGEGSQPGMDPNDIGSLVA